MYIGMLNVKAFAQNILEFKVFPTLLHFKLFVILFLSKCVTFLIFQQSTVKPSLEQIHKSYISVM